MKTPPSQFVHGHASALAQSPTYRSWLSMLRRCSPDAPDEKRRVYADRGITVCARWRDDFVSFLSDMGERPDGKTLDRIDNDLGYHPGNCRWATAVEQSNNRRSARRVEIDGVTRTVAEWAVSSGVGHSSICARLRRGDHGADLIRPVVRYDRGTPVPDATPRARRIATCARYNERKRACWTHKKAGAR